MADSRSGGSSPGLRGLAVVGLAAGVALIVSLAVTYVVSPGGAPQRPSHGAWVDQAHTSLEQVASDVATVQLLLRLVEKDKVLGKYQQVVALDSESSTGKVADHFGAEQPPVADQATYAYLTTVMSDAGDLLSTVRIAVVRHDEFRYPALQRELAKTQRQLTRAEGRVPS